ncbi:MAG: c-type cytochrome [Verrucomicrobia bacterium]|nr:c-type cytochrome [Verrucomicrobiota bacterium]
MADLVDGKADIDRVADFMRLLAPPARGASTAASLAGERIFNTLDCAVCHTPSMRTERHAIAALSEKPVGLYSDLLLHDMGALGDGIVQGTAGARDMRTAPLWGLPARPTWLHDGRANTVDQAIRGHAGEAQNSRDRYVALTDEERTQLLAFLDTL